MVALGHNNPPPMTPTADHAAITAEIRALLSSAPQQTVARKLGVTRQAVSNYVRGEREPSLFDLCLIARAMGRRLALVPVEG